MSNFLGDVGGGAQRSMILSAAALIAREGVDLHKGMNFRNKGVQLSVFLVLERPGRAGEDGFKDAWDAEKGIYEYQGHDSTTAESGKLVDQIAMYESGKLSDNGKFYKAAQEYKDGMQREALQVQVYEKLDPGVWFDKGIFDLIDAEQAKEHDRAVFKFRLVPMRGGQAADDFLERMIPAAAKARLWQKYNGRCAACGSEVDLYFTPSKDARLLCAPHSGRESRGLL